MFAFGLNHRTAPVDVREKLYLDESEIRTLLAEFKRTLSECVIISTCNRTEFYGVTTSTEVDPRLYIERVIELKKARGVVRDEHFFSLMACAACQQLFSVATSVDSQVIGDSQVLKQLRRAYAIARESGAAGKVLNQMLQRAFKIGKKTFTATAIHHGSISVSLAAVELAVKTFGSLVGRSVLVVGGGETARLTAEALVNKRVGKIIIANRTRSTAEALSAALPRSTPVETEIIDLGNFIEYLDQVDIVISSTGSSEPIIHKEDLARRRKKILLIDIAVPRDIESSVSDHPNVILKNIDDLHSVVDENREKRLRDLPKVRKLIMSETVDFLMWYYSLHLMVPYKKTGSKPPREQADEIIRLKSFLAGNVPEIHKLAASSSGDFREDLKNHVSLITRLQEMKVVALGV